MKQCKVVFRPDNKVVVVPAGVDLLAAAARCGVGIHANCGGQGLCGKCKVVVKEGIVKTEPTEFVSDEERGGNVVLACQALVESDLLIAVPEASSESRKAAAQSTEDFTKGVVLGREHRYAFSPLVRKFYIEIEKPAGVEDLSDADRLCMALDKKLDHLAVSTTLAQMKHLSEILHQSDYKVTVAAGYRDGGVEIIGIEPGDTAGASYGVAFDIGTTTVVGQLIDLTSGDIMGSRIVFNKQATYGSDVITRILYAAEPQGLQYLNDAVIENMNEIIVDLLDSHRVNQGDLWGVACAGNMTMMHLLLKIDPSEIRKPPYMPAVSAFPTMQVGETGVRAYHKGLIAFAPGVSTYVGGDIVAGVLACGLCDDPDLSMLVDIGTNGEIVLGNNEWMIGAAASAGPSFEGSGLACGMKAVRGAIQKVAIDERGEVSADAIGGVPPSGICGSGYIDLLCQLLKRGLIDKNGKFNLEKGCGRIRKGDVVLEFVVAAKGEKGASCDIVIDENDIENLKRAKGAIYSAIIALANKVEKDIAEVKKIYIAGGFGNYLNIENAIFIGLLPDIDRTVYEFIGNSSLAGARMMLVSHEAYARTAQIAKNITYIDLSSEPRYMDEYVAALFFPHTDQGRFPSVRL